MTMPCSGAAPTALRIRSTSARKFRRFVRLQLVAFGQHETDPQRAQHDRTGHAQDDDGESHVRVDRRPHHQQVQEHEDQQAPSVDSSVTASTA